MFLCINGVAIFYPMGQNQAFNSLLCLLLLLNALFVNLETAAVLMSALAGFPPLVYALLNVADSSHGDSEPCPCYCR